MALAFSFSSQRANTAPATGAVASGLANGGEGLGYGAEMPAAAPQVLDPAFQVMAMAQSAPALNSAAPEPAPIHTTELLGSAMQRETGAASQEVLEDLSEQLEQLRNDFFSAVTTISALSDRIERLEQRQHGPGTPSPEISELRTDVQNWITHHMDAAVEQRMRLIWERCQAASPQPPQG